MGIAEYLNNWNTGIEEPVLKTIKGKFPDGSSCNFKEYFDNASLGIVHFSSEGYITYFNPFFQNLIEIEEKIIRTFPIFSLQDVILLDAVNKVLNGGSANYEGFYKSIITKKTLPLKILLSPVIKNNVVTGGIAFVEDISFRKQLERFFFHDILNHCGNVRNLSEILNDGKINPELFEKITKQINSQSNKLLDEIKVYKYLLAFGKTDLRPVSKKINSDCFLEKSLKSIYDDCFGENHKFKIINAGNSIEFNCDPLLLKKIMDLMIKTFISISEKEDIISISCEPVNNSICLALKNTRPIKNELFRFLFEKCETYPADEKFFGIYCMNFLAEKYLAGCVRLTINSDNETVLMLTFPAV